jgi:hypothetical protein
VMRRMTSGSRPSLKFGTHSIRAGMDGTWDGVAAIYCLRTGVRASPPDRTRHRSSAGA